MHFVVLIYLDLVLAIKVGAPTLVIQHLTTGVLVRFESAFDISAGCPILVPLPNSRVLSYKFLLVLLRVSQFSGYYPLVLPCH